MEKKILNFALVGAAGYIAPRHMKAIADTGNRIVAALDPFDCMGKMDSFFPDSDFFTEPERFDRHLDKLRRKNTGKNIDYVSICSPNYLHDAHIRLALRNQAHAICEKPIVLNPWNVDALQEIEKESGKKIFTILQLRHHPAIVALKKKVDDGPQDKIYNVDLSYFTSRGRWYFISWKGDITKSGGVATNIGVHFFDMLSWIFGKVIDVHVTNSQPDKVSGFLELERARVKWQLSLDVNDIPVEVLQRGQRTYRSITVDGEEIEFSQGFTDLHTVAYEKILAGEGYGLEAARNSINIVHKIRNTGK
ncbi:MAG: Gfo/Idh/MocA family oxidoreductase [Bacteroidales bacterium]|jgi:UDP-N-acetyl-2-amino-2-deoxyglucuronate dehydrogenase|nr:Gfo/Idh/MocA family oxidoreductase [Bacteroidales bacterium]MDD2633744.1 Gfo/Idh/MocA family oxidoreductase [Bacteroidales bacterium]MDD3528126.1 Gfo/Idh/MocA family oxidoreductase [Bacteroidales bacterium]MDD4178329.1 Gfo/Idh/MocA family oxidoreductase [Bacteroidales bacterium]MDD4742100.1 Gfo/Idh/MocA family oxidoreductase [Bacteroidales bacterium]